MASSSRLNVILLTVDAFRRDRSSLYGYARPTTPNLERLAKNAIVCEQTFSLGTFTQSASIQLLTSSLPLSYGGYDDGALGRPETVFKRFHAAGYHTTCFSTLHWVNRYFGYGNGLDREVHLFSLSSLAGVALAMIRSSLNGFYAGKISTEEMLGVVKPVLFKVFDDLEDYCGLQVEQRDQLRGGFPDSAVVNAGYDFARIFKLIDRHRQALRRDATAYIRAQLLPAPGWDEWLHRWIPGEARYRRVPSKLVEEGILRLINKIIGIFNPRQARLRNNRFKISADARSLANNVIMEIERLKESSPFFIWTHFMDTHAPYVSGPGRKWYRETPKYLAALGYDRTIDPGLTFDGKPLRKEDERGFSALYDAAVRSTDEEIGRIIAALDRLDLRRDTLVVISGDHGEELGDHGDFGHYFLLYDHNTRIPMMFHHPDLSAQKVMGLTTTLDLAPTIATLTGIRPASGWSGTSVTDNSVALRRHVLLETFYGGNCIFEHRPLYFGVRTDDDLYLWKEYRDPGDRFSLDGQELYDVNKDPGQQNNIYHPENPAVKKGNEIIRQRLEEIDEISPERIARAFR